jgi:hypothetical protein
MKNTILKALGSYVAAENNGSRFRVQGSRFKGVRKKARLFC